MDQQATILADASTSDFMISGPDKRRITTFDKAEETEAACYWWPLRLAGRAHAAFAKATSWEPVSQATETRPSTDWEEYSGPYVGPDEVVMLPPMGRFFVTVKVTAVRPGPVSVVDP